MLSNRARVGLDALELVLLALLTPILLFPRGNWPWLALLLPAVWIGERALGRRLIPASPLNPAIAILAVMAVVSTVASIDPSVGWPKLAALTLGFVVFVVVLRLAVEPGRVVWLVRLHLLAGLALAAAVILGTAWIDKWPAVARLTARLPVLIRGLPGAEEGFHPNAGAGSLLLFAPAALWTLREGTIDRATRRLAAAATVATGAAIVLTQSRGGLLALPIGLFLFFTIKYRSRWGLTVLLTGVVAATLVLNSPARLSKLIPRAAGPNVEFALAFRLEVWSRTVDFIGEHPWYGVGFNGLRHQLPAERPLFLTEAYQEPVHAHNQLLQAAADLGLAGLAAYVALWIVAIRMLTHTMRMAARPHALLAEGLLLSLLCHFVFGMADAIPLGAKVGVAFWLTLAVASVIGILTARTRDLPGIPAPAGGSGFSRLS